MFNVFSKMADLYEMLQGHLNPKENNHKLHSLVIPNHLRQMFMFGRRKGVELYAKQDVNQMRQSFVEKQYNYNKIPLYEKAIWDTVGCNGNILFYFFRDEFNNYPIRFLPEENYKTFYSPYGQLEKVIIIYSYEVHPDNSMQGMAVGMGNKRWIKITIQKDYIYEENSDTKPDMMASSIYQNPKNKTYINSFGFIPCVEVNYNAKGVGQKGVSDFEAIKTQLENLEVLEYSIDDNLSMFAGTTLFTSLNPAQVLEGIGGYQDNYDRAYGNSLELGWSPLKGFNGLNTISSPKNRSMASQIMGEDRKVKRIIGNMDKDDNIAFLTPDPVTPDHHRHLLEKREQAHNALGGLDELGLSTNATAYEMRTMFGKVETTALLMAEHIYTYGLCLLFEMMIYAEENRFIINLAKALKKEPNEITLDLIADLRKKEKLPNVGGLEPLGNREIKWRYKGDVFSRDSREILDDSIVARNLQEMGVNSFEAMRHLFPDKTDRELEDILAGGYPFRYIGAIASQIQQLIGIYGNALKLPHNENPKAPLAVDVQIGNLLRRSLDTIYKELDYARNYESADTGNYFPESSAPRVSTAPDGSAASNPSTGNASASDQSATGSIFSEPSVAGGLSSFGWHPYSPEFSANRVSNPIATNGNIQPVSSISTTSQPTGLQYNAFPSPNSIISESANLSAESANLSANSPTDIPADQPSFIPNRLGRSIYGDSTYESTRRPSKQKRTNKNRKRNRS